MRKAVHLLSFSLFLFLSSCAVLQQLIQEPKIQLHKVDVDMKSFPQATFNFLFDVENPNPVSLPISALTYNLKLNGVQMTAGTAKKNIHLPAGKKSIVELPLQMNIEQFVSSLSSLFKATNIEYDLSGQFNVGPLSIPYNRKGPIELPRKLF